METFDRDFESSNSKLFEEGESYDEENYNKGIQESQNEMALSKEENLHKANDLISKLNDDENMEKSIDSFIDDIKINGDVIDFDSFKKIGDGGTHDVFMSDKSKDFVLKINRGAFKMVREKKKDGGLSDKDYGLINEFMNEKNSKNNSLYRYFGIGNCLYENMRLVKIKYDNEIFECPVVFQKNTDLFSNTDKVDFGTGYINDVNDEIGYKKLNDMLLTDKYVSYSSKNELVNLIPKSKDIFDRIRTNPGFAEKVKGFLVSFKGYYKSEGEIIDLVGKDNVLFYPEGDKWHFKLGSVVKNTTRDEVNKVLLLLETNPEKIDEKSLNHLKNLLACSRFLNCLGIELGLGKIIELNLTTIQIENLNKMKI